MTFYSDDPAPWGGPEESPTLSDHSVLQVLLAAGCNCGFKAVF